MNTVNNGEKLPEDKKKEAGLMEIPNELKKSLESLETKKKCDNATMPNISVSASAMECTGLMYAAPKDAEEYSSYQELYSMEIPQECDEP